jgi:hypothetical protein
MRSYTTSFVAQKKAMISTIHNNANFWGGGGLGRGGRMEWGSLFHPLFHPLSRRKRTKDDASAGRQVQ